MGAIEKRLCGALSAHMREFQCQDLQCVRCRAVVSRHLRPGCGLCGGDVRATLPPVVFRKRLAVFRWG